jgi:hypothetical protein
MKHKVHPVDKTWTKTYQSEGDWVLKSHSFTVTLNCYPDDSQLDRS